MTRLVTAIGLTLAVTVGLAHHPVLAGKPAPKPVDAEGRALYIAVALPGASESTIANLTRLGFDIEGRSDGSAVAYVSLEEIEKLEALSIPWVVVPELGPGTPSSDPRAKPGVAEGEDVEMAGYHDYDSMTTELLQVATDHPDITRRVSAGPSVQGRELWWLLITDNPDTPEDEPGFKYIATMHGDEKVGTENCMQLIARLTDEYGTTQRITDLVDNVEIWIMPLMNPDGHTLSQRYNANGVDLNRDFPDRLDDPVNAPAGRAIETQHVMNWQTAHWTTLSANFHGGAVVVNYPYDNNLTNQTVYTAAPDDDVIVDVSLEYSEDNSPMYNGSWPQGITNGADWYVVSGGMQDWNYDYHGDVEVTIELSNTKTPQASQLAGFWTDNEESMLSYMERVLTGVRGIVTDAATGQPLPAELSVAGRDVPFFADPAVGDYHRVMPAGSFTLNVSAPGYQVKSVPFSVADPEAAATRVDVQLDAQATSLAEAGMRVDADTGADGWLDPGESGALAVTLENLGAAASGISGSLRALTPHASVTSGATWPALGPGFAAESDTPHLGLDVASAAPPGHKLGFAIDWTTAEGAAGTTEAFFVGLGAPAQAQDAASGLPLPINDFSPIDSTLTVTEDVELSEVNVRVDLTHTYIGDLVVTLVAPDSTEIRLHDHSGGTTNDIHAWYDTDVAPVDSLDLLRGKSSQGTWTLRVHDQGGGDTGTLDGWTLERYGRVWESPVAAVLLSSVTPGAGGETRFDWWPVGSAESYLLYRATDPSLEAGFADVTAGDPDPADASYLEASAPPAGTAWFYLVVASGHTGEGLWEHFGR